MLAKAKDNELLEDQRCYKEELVVPDVHSRRKQRVWRLGMVSLFLTGPDATDLPELHNSTRQ